MNLEISILQVLESIHPRMERQPVIVADVKNCRVQSPTSAEVERALRKLEDKKHIIGVSNEDTGTKWKLTDAGVVRLAEFNI